MAGKSKSGPGVGIDGKANEGEGGQGVQGSEWRGEYQGSRRVDQGWS